MCFHTKHVQLNKIGKISLAPHACHCHTSKVGRFKRVSFWSHDWWEVLGLAYLDIWPKIVSNSKKIPVTNCKLVVFSTFYWIDELQAIPTSVFFQKSLSFLWQNNWEIFGNFCFSSVNSCKLAIFLERFASFFILKKMEKKKPWYQHTQYLSIPSFCCSFEGGGGRCCMHLASNIP